ncbi:MAG: ATP-binding protein, partial [Cyanobacteria bacterium J06555_13]
QRQITALSRLSVLTNSPSEADEYQQARQQFFQALDDLAQLIPASDQQSHIRIQGIRQQHSYLDHLAKQLLSDRPAAMESSTAIESSTAVKRSAKEAEEVARSLKIFEKNTGAYTRTLLKSANKQTEEYNAQQNAVRRQIAWIEALGFCVVMSLLIAQFYYLLRPVIKSLKTLQIGADQIGRHRIGRSHTDAPPKIELTTGDELQDLAKAFNQMGNRLADSYTELEHRVETRTRELHRANQALTEEVGDRIEAEASLTAALAQLKQTQLQLLQTEKMSSLGQLVAGVAHEINNPVSFIQGNLTPANEYMHCLLELIRGYQAEYPKASEELLHAIEKADLDFIQTDFPRLLASMKNGSDRIQNIVRSLKTFSRLDESETKSADIHDGLESSIMLLGTQLSATAYRPEVNIVRHYGQLPPVYCYPGQLNQVFMGILTNAIDALTPPPGGSAPLSRQPTITLITEADEASVRIRIADNGTGMDKKVCRQIFDPFFTTKPVGSGMGLGLAMGYQIVVTNHRGNITCDSTLGKGTTFTIEIPLSLQLKLQTAPVVTVPGSVMI